MAQPPQTTSGLDKCPANTDELRIQRMELENPAWEAGDSTLVSVASAFAIMGGNSSAFPSELFELQAYIECIDIRKVQSTICNLQSAIALARR